MWRLTQSLARLAASLIVSACFSVSLASAQGFPIEPSLPTTQSEGLREVGRAADSAVGEVGRRKNTTTAAPNVEPMRRANNRIESRIENRIANRIDRWYDPDTDAAASVEQARARLDPIRRGAE